MKNLDKFLTLIKRKLNEPNIVLLLKIYIIYNFV